MTDADMVAALTSAAQRLLSQTVHRDVDGADVVREAGYDLGTPGLYDAFWEIKRRGELDMYFPGGMGMPNMIHLR